MDNASSNPHHSQIKQKNKVKNFNGEFYRFKEYLERRIATCTMAAFELGIYRPSACRYKRRLQKSGVLIIAYKGICKITGFTAEYLTINKDLAIEDVSLRA